MSGIPPPCWTATVVARRGTMVALCRGGAQISFFMCPNLLKYVSGYV